MPRFVRSILALFGLVLVVVSASDDTRSQGLQDLPTVASKGVPFSPTPERAAAAGPAYAVIAE